MDYFIKVYNQCFFCILCGFDIIIDKRWMLFSMVVCASPHTPPCVLIMTINRSDREDVDVDADID